MVMYQPVTKNSKANPPSNYHNLVDQDQDAELILQPSMVIALCSGTSWRSSSMPSSLKLCLPNFHPPSSMCLQIPAIEQSSGYMPPIAWNTLALKELPGWCKTHSGGPHLWRMSRDMSRPVLNVPSQDMLLVTSWPFGATPIATAPMVPHCCGFCDGLTQLTQLHHHPGDHRPFF